MERHCDDDVITKLKKKDKKVTGVKKVKDGFMVTWIYNTHCGAAGFYKVKVKVHTSGKIERTEGGERFVNCGKGKMY